MYTGSELLARVAAVLDKQQEGGTYTKEAQNLVLSSKAILIAMGKLQIFEKEMKTRHGGRGAERRKTMIVHPLQALEDTMGVPWKRRCVVYAILYHGNLFLPQMNFLSSISHMWEFFGVYKDGLKGKLNLAREKHENAPYTFHIVSRYNVNEALLKRGGKKDKHTIDDKRLQKAIKDHNGELALHRFICLPDLQSALFFFHRWSKAQMAVLGKQATCLMECGPPDDTIKRKWIVDVDAALKDLKAFNLLEDPAICTEQVKKPFILL